MKIKWINLSLLPFFIAISPCNKARGRYDANLYKLLDVQIENRVLFFLPIYPFRVFSSFCRAFFNKLLIVSYYWNAVTYRFQYVESRGKIIAKRAAHYMSHILTL